MNINNVELNYSQLAQYDIDISKCCVKSGRVTYKHKGNNSYLLTDGEKFICINTNGEIVTDKLCGRAYTTKNFLALEYVFDNIPEKYTQKSKWYIDSFENANNQRLREYFAEQAEKQKTDQSKAEAKKDIAPSTKAKRIHFGKETRGIVFEKSHGKCAICGMPLSLNHHSEYNYMTIDHIVPLDKGGRNEMSNYQATCEKCNQIKTNIMPEIFKNNVASVMFESIINDNEYQNTVLKLIFRRKVKHFVLTVKAAIL